MGKPATTYWCENGHLLEHNNAHEHGEYDWIDHVGSEGFDTCYPPCDICQSIKVVWSLDWGDPDHLDPVTLQFEVPLKPIRHEEIEKVDNYGNKYYIDIPVYDISKLLTKKSSN